MSTHDETVNVSLPVTVQLSQTGYGYPDPDDPTKVGGYEYRWRWSVVFARREVGRTCTTTYPTRKAALVAGRKARAEWARNMRKDGASCV